MFWTLVNEKLAKALSFLSKHKIHAKYFKLLDRLKKTALKVTKKVAISEGTAV